MSKKEEQPFPRQHQEEQPATEAQMEPKPGIDNPRHTATGKLRDKIAVVTGADSGIGRAVAVLFAGEGADLVVVYYNEHEDAGETKRLIEIQGRTCMLLPGDIGEERFCESIVDKTLGDFGKIDILINNAAVQFPKESLEEITSEQLERTFRTNIYSMFYLTKAALKHLKKGSIIINTASVTAYEGSPKLLDYSSTKGAIVAFTRSLALSLVERDIRVNAVAPGPVWTPLVTSFPEDKVEKFGTNTPMGRAGQPWEIAPCYLFLATEDSSYITGQVIHPNGGRIING